MDPMEVNQNDDEDGEGVPSLLEYMPSVVLLEIFKFVEWNDLCHLSQTCKKFRDICMSSSLWLSLKTLDFRQCGIPDETKILKILKQTPNAESILLGDVITLADERPPLQAPEDALEEEEALQPADKYVLSILRACPKLKNIDLYMHGITDRTIEAICAKCVYLRKLAVHDNGRIRREAIRELVSLNTSLTELWIEGCEGVHFLQLKHTDSNKSLNLTKVSLNGQMLVADQVQQLISSCPSLTHLDLAGAIHLDRFSINDQPQHRPKSGLDNLVELVLTGCDDLRMVSLPYCPALQSLDVANCFRLAEISGTCSQLSLLCTSHCDSLQKVDLASSGLHSLALTGMEDLDTLHIGSSRLQTLNVSDCTRLTADQVVAAAMDRDSLTHLNLCGCKGIPPEHVDTIILPQLTKLQKLVYGGYAWNKVQLDSNSLRELEYSKCINTCGVQLNMASLEHLKLQDCRDFTEQDIVDSLLYGRQITRMQGLDSLIDTSVKEPPFANGRGTPALQSLHLHSLPGLHGELLSHWLVYCRQLNKLELVHCTFLTHLTVNGWPELTSLKIESCNRLSNLAVTNVPNLASVVVRWCSMVQHLAVTGEKIMTLEMTGTNFANVNINCDNLGKLQMGGVCTQPKHTAQIRCRQLQELSIEKCDHLSDKTFSSILQDCPKLRSVCLLGSFSVSQLCLPSTIDTCSLTGLRVLKQISLDSPVNIKHLTLNNLPKLIPADRQVILSQCRDSLKILEVRAIRGETTLSLCLPNLQSLTLDQGINLQTLEIKCPKLQYLRIQGCPWLSCLTLHLASLSQVQVYHSMPLLALRQLDLHCPRVAYLPTILHYYCPSLERLNLYKSVMRANQLYGLGRSLSKLHSLNLHGCSVKDLHKQGTSLLIESSVIDRNNGQNLAVVFHD